MTQIGLNLLIEQRYSPRSFQTIALEQEKLDLLLLAATRAPSSSNVQPWRFLYAHHADIINFQLFSDALSGNNRTWAPHASILMLSLALKNGPSGNPNRYALHDTGAAVANLSLQALHMGLFVHQMGGFEHEVVRQNLQIPEEVELGAMIAIGYLAHPNQLPTEMAETELKRTTRKPIEQIAMSGKFALSLLS